LDVLIEKWINKKNAVYDFIANDNIAHTLWIVNDDKTVKEIGDIFCSEISCTYIADGHHRAASAAKVRQSLSNKKTQVSDYFLTTLFPSNQLQILDYNRVIKTLNDLTQEEFLQLLKNEFEIEPQTSAYKPELLHTFGLYINGEWYKLTSKPGTYAEDPIGIWM
jgi:uncharacterized protein (DUF1015 family)